MYATVFVHVTLSDFFFFPSFVRSQVGFPHLLPFLLLGSVLWYCYRTPLSSSPIQDGFSVHPHILLSPASVCQSVFELVVFNQGKRKNDLKCPLSFTIELFSRAKAVLYIEWKNVHALIKISRFGRPFGLDVSFVGVIRR
ncbi:hypothetical protein L218DRAFT_580151 [Marasmius fiardii PR-910]|nr:hypothetical protein L218DRAFT_580151 [Marasmius fiardii PR-910]